MINKIETDVGANRFTILVGGNSHENDALIKESEPEDYWVHISDFPSAHAIVRPHNSGKFPLKPIKRACLMVKQKSNKCKSIQKLQFDVTKIKHIEPTPISGQVIIRKILRNINI
jgi:predicted ribosome quality control (RQC) complex YloA/Tae2 family protein